MSKVDSLINVDIKGICRELNNQSIAKGFYDDAFNINPHEDTAIISRQLMLIISELTEAYEAFRTNGINYVQPIQPSNEDFVKYVKDTFQDEIADTIIRIFDLLGFLDIDIVPFIIAKNRYNKTRGYKHGKNF